MLALVVVVSAGCQVEVRVGVDVDADGSGEVDVAVALDEDAVDRVPDLADQVQVDDLVAAGWRVSGPTLEPDGRTWLRAAKPFATPEDASLVFDEVGGVDGPFRDFEVRRVPTLLRDVWRFAGTVDLSDGTATFSDDALRARLGGTDLGRSTAEIEEAIGAPLDRALRFRVEADLPGEVSGNGGPAGPAVWQPALGERVDLVATGQLDAASVSWFAVALVAALAAVVLVVVGGAGKGRRRRRSGRSGASGVTSEHTG